MSKVYDLEERTFTFAKNVALFCKSQKFDSVNKTYYDQVIRSSGSIGANYIEANESLSKKDFIYKIRICLKEAKETGYWLRLLIETNSEFNDSIRNLFNESVELKKIFSSILEKSK